MGMFDRLTGLFDDESHGPSGDDSEPDAGDAGPEPERFEDEAGTAPDTVLVESEGEVPAVEGYGLSSPNPAILERLATTLAETWPEYDLDGSPESLARFDELVRTEVDDPSSQSDALGAYLGEVFVETYDGTWTEVDGVGWVVELTDPDDPGDQKVLAMPLVLRDCLSGEATFASTHEAFLDETGRTGPSVGSGTGASPSE